MNIFTRVCCFAIAGMFFAFSGFAQQTYFVKSNAAGSNNGTSWLNAFNDLQSALDVATNGDQIWVAAGTYKPSKDHTGSATPTDVREKVFILNNGVKLYGGFAGTEPSIAERNIALNVTILSGDRLGDDADGFVNMSDNCYHVVGVNTPDSPTVLDGVTVTGGNSDNGTFEKIFLGQNFGYLYGGGIFTVDGSKFTLSNCIIKGNKGYHGGGMLNRRTPPVVMNCVFTKNKATRAGGAIFFENVVGTPTIGNTVMVNNTATEFGSAVYNRNTSPVITNTTIASNSVPVNGGTIYNESPSAPVIRNSIIYKNAGDNPIINQSGANATVTYTNIEFGYTGTGNINTDPIFNKLSDPDGGDNLWRTADDGIHLRTISTSADAGNNTYAAGVTTDITGATRIQNTTVAMGAYETVKPLYTLYVKKNATGANDGTSWVNAFTSLQSALEASENGDQIWVAAGTYIPSKDDAGNATPANPRKKAFILKNGVKLYGGFSGIETSTGERNWRSNQTILSGDINGNDLPNLANMSDNCYHVVGVDRPDSPTVLDGVTVKGGNSDNGIFEDVFLGQQFGFLYGGGIFTVNGSNFTLSNSIVSGNVAYHGGGLLARGTSPSVINCVFTGNKANRAGGAIFFENSSAESIINNTVIENNTATEFGGAIFNRNTTALLTNNTIVNNRAQTNGSAIYNENPSSSIIQNTIVWGNTGGVTIFNQTGAAASVHYSLIQGGFAGTANVDQDPLFVASADPNGPDDIWMTTDDGFSLLTGSPASEAGSNAAIVAGTTTDITGDARIIGAKVNIGAYERVKQVASVSLSNTMATYDGAAHYVTVTTNPVGLAHTVTYKKGGLTETPVNAGDYDVFVVITDPDYAGSAAGLLKINKANQTVTLHEPETTYVGDIFEIEASTTSGLDLSFWTSNESVATIEGNTVTLVGEGEVTITANQPGNSEYYENYAEMVLVVTKKIQTITFESLTERILGEEPFALEATTTSGLAITYTSSDPSVATIDGNIVTLTGGGETFITAHQDGNEFYDAAPSIEQRLEVILVASAENPNGKALKVYPNPAKNFITVEGHDAKTANTVTLIDNNGRNLNARCVTIGDGMQLDLSHLPSGIYYLRAMTRDGLTVTKVIKN
jgi:predicted outer membrane repeat protein